MDSMSGSRPKQDPAPAAEWAAIERLVAAVRATPEAFVDAAAMAAASGWSRRQLEHRMLRHYHTAPEVLLARARTARAAESLRTSRQRVAGLGEALGFTDREAFDRDFESATGLKPAAYRRMTVRRSFVLRLPADFNAAATWRYLGRDAERTTERTEPQRGRALRVLRHGNRRCALELERRGRSLAVRVLGGRQPAPVAMSAFHDQIWRWLGLAAETAAFERRAARQPGWPALLRRQAGLRLPQTPTVFEGLMWAMVGQQVNLAFAYRLRRALAELCQPELQEGLRGHPRADEVAQLDYRDLTRRQFSRRKAEYVIDAARLAAARRGGFEVWAGQSATRVAAELDAIRGVGEWTQQYVLMRSCGFADCVPVGDAGLVKALQRFHGLAARPDAPTTRALLASLAPHRSLATAHLWASLQAEAPSSNPRPGGSVREPAALSHKGDET
jgi:AraC family transcriptional regulator of adaptative response / DNA-3-methyladenine glycosylase II